MSVHSVCAVNRYVASPTQTAHKAPVVLPLVYCMLGSEKKHVLAWTQRPWIGARSEADGWPGVTFSNLVRTTSTSVRLDFYWTY